MYLEVFLWTEWKTERSQYDLKEKICPIPKIENSEISEISFTLNYDTDYNSRFKNNKKINWDKN